MNVKIEESWRRHIGAEFDKQYFTDLAEFSLYIHAAGMGEPGDKPAFIYIFFKRKRRSVIHDRIEPGPDSPDACSDTLAMVKMDSHRHLGFAGGLEEYRCHKFHRRIRELHFRQLENQRGMQLFGCVHSPQNILQAQTVERPYSIMSAVSVIYDLFKWSQHNSFD